MSPDEEKLARRLLGTWTLLRFEELDGGGVPVRFPFGPDAGGLLVYTPDGRMSAQLSTAGRPRFAAGGGLAERARERAGAFDTFVAYCGRFRVDGDEVAHEVELSLYPNWIGTTLRRRVRFDGEQLTLTTAPDRAGRAQRLIWRRVDP